MTSDRRLEWDWYPGRIPDNVVIDPTAYCETSFSFHLFQSTEPEAVRYGRGASTYLGTMFDLGPRARVSLGDFALVHGARIICDRQILIGDHALISWNVVLMDTYRLPADPQQRRRVLEQVARSPSRRLAAEVEAKPIIIEANVWIGFDACVLPGVTIGRGSIVGARSVVTQSVEPYTIVAGNPARVIRTIDKE